MILLCFMIKTWKSWQLNKKCFNGSGVFLLKLRSEIILQHSLKYDNPFILFLILGFFLGLKTKGLVAWATLLCKFSILLNTFFSSHPCSNFTRRHSRIKNWSSYQHPEPQTQGPSEYGSSTFNKYKELTFNSLFNVLTTIYM
jgi:hypothetical protein